MYYTTTTAPDGMLERYAYQVINGQRRQVSYECFWPEKVTEKSMRAEIENKYGEGLVKQLEQRTYRNGGCCVILAVAYATDQDPRDVQRVAFENNFQLSKAEAKRRRASWDGGGVWTGTHMDKRSLEAMCGKSLERVNLGKTVGQALKANKSGTYIVSTRDHAFVIEDGCVIDQRKGRNQMRRRITQAYKVS